MLFTRQRAVGVKCRCQAVVGIHFRLNKLVIVREELERFICVTVFIQYIFLRKCDVKLNSDI